MNNLNNPLCEKQFLCSFIVCFQNHNLRLVTSRSFLGKIFGCLLSVKKTISFVVSCVSRFYIHMFSKTCKIVVYSCDHILFLRSAKKLGRTIRQTQSNFVFKWKDFKAFSNILKLFPKMNLIGKQFFPRGQQVF